MTHPFGHREHLQVAWRHLDGHEIDDAVAHTGTIIRSVARAQGAPDKYHHTITEAWVRLIAHHRDLAPSLGFDALVERFPRILDKQLLDGHYSRKLLSSPAARLGWVEPDLRPLPV